jgi:hypothetical protein
MFFLQEVCQENGALPREILSVSEHLVRVKLTSSAAKEAKFPALNQA